MASHLVSTSPLPWLSSSFDDQEPSHENVDTSCYSFQSSSYISSPRSTLIIDGDSEDDMNTDSGVFQSSLTELGLESPPSRVANPLVLDLRFLRRDDIQATRKEVQRVLFTHMPREISSNDLSFYRRKEATHAPPADKLFGVPRYSSSC